MTLSRMNQRHPYYWDPVVSNQTYRNQVVKFALNSAVKVKSGLSSLQEGVMDRFNQMQIPDAINRIRGSFSSSPAEDVSKEEKSEPGNAGEPTVEIDLDDKWRRDRLDFRRPEMFYTWIYIISVKIKT